MPSEQTDVERAASEVRNGLHVVGLAIVASAALALVAVGNIDWFYPYLVVLVLSSYVFNSRNLHRGSGNDDGPQRVTTTLPSGGSDSEATRNEPVGESRPSVALDRDMPNPGPLKLKKGLRIFAEPDKSAERDEPEPQR